MQPQSLVRRAWANANLDNNTRLQPLFERLKADGVGCWPDLSQEVRDHYADYKEQLITPIWDTGDKMLRLNLIRVLSPENEDEVAIFQRLIQRPDLHGNHWELEALMRVAQRRGIV